MASRIPKTTYLLIFSVLLQTVHALSVPYRRARYTLNENAFTWNDNCNDPNPQNTAETKRTAVERALIGSFELNDESWNRFSTVTWPRIKNTEVPDDDQEYINTHDPAYVPGSFYFSWLDSRAFGPITNSLRWATRYVQLFALDSSEDGRTKVQNVLQALSERANADPGTNNRPDDAKIELRCGDTWVDDGVDACKNAAGTGSAAATESDPDEETSTINFCPRFFTQPRFDQLRTQSAEYIQNLYHDKDYMGTDGTWDISSWTLLKTSY